MESTRIKLGIIGIKQGWEGFSKEQLVLEKKLIETCKESNMEIGEVLAVLDVAKTTILEKASSNRL